MSLDQLVKFFQWMTIINAGLFLISSILSMLFKTVVTKTHAALFGIPEEQVPVIQYGYLGIYRIFILVFNIVRMCRCLFYGRWVTYKICRFCGCPILRIREIYGLHQK